MSFVGSMLGNSNGSGYQASGTNIVTPTTADQANQAQSQNQTSLAQQQALVNATQAQNGLGNQSSVYNQLQGVANGTGANPAQAQLAQATGANTANQAALMAGQRGSGANVGLMARQAAQTGAANQQNSVGQAATLQANQSLNALNNMGNLATSQANNQIGAVGALNSDTQTNQANLLNSINAQNNSNVSMQSNMNNNNQAIANTNAQGQQAIVGGVMNAAGGALSMAKGGMAPAYDEGGPSLGVDTTFQGAPPAAPALTQPTMTAPTAAPAPSLGSSLPGDLAQSQNAMSVASIIPSSGPQSSLGKATVQASQAPSQGGGGGGGSDAGAQALFQGASKLGSGLAGQSSSSGGGSSGGGGISSIMQSLGPMALAAAGGGMPMKPMPSGQPHNMKSGGGVPGKAKVDGAKNTLKNDTVPAVLSPGEIVIPRSITQGKDPANEGAKFIAAIMSKKGATYLPSKGKR